METFTAKQLKKQYRQGNALIRAVDDCSLTILRGERVALIGASGSGKSTLLRLLGGMEKPNSGSVCVDGEDITKYSIKKLQEFRRRKVGYVFQDYKLLPVLTAYENIITPLLLDRKKPNRAKVQELAELLGIEERLDHFPEQLSGGERQRVAIGRAVIHQPDILLADEPTGNLDKKSAMEVAGLLFDAAKKIGQTMLVVTHEAEIAKMADRILVMDNGKLTQGSM